MGIGVFLILNSHGTTHANMKLDELYSCIPIIHSWPHVGFLFEYKSNSGTGVMSQVPFPSAPQSSVVLVTVCSDHTYYGATRIQPQHATDGLL
jgi:hypothetical protein